MSRETTHRAERKFGLTFSALFAALAFLPLLHRGQPRPWLLFPAIAFLLAALALPKALARLNRLWLALGNLLGRIMSPLLMGVLFAFVITPLAVIMRLMGKDPLRLGKKAEGESYLLERSAKPDPDWLKNQF